MTCVRFVCLVPVLAFISGCASQIPLVIREAPPDNPTVQQVRNYPEQYQGRAVRWGGTIASVENKEDATWIEVVATELDHYGRPKDTDQSPGRFLVRIDGFLDPQIYRLGRSITVYGKVESRTERRIDEYPYTYPLLRGLSYYLWREYPDWEYAYTYPGRTHYFPRYYFSPYYRNYFGGFYGHPYYPFGYRYLWWW